MWSGFFKNKYKLALSLGAVFLAVTLLAGSLVYFREGLPLVAPEEAEPVAVVEPEPEAETEPATEPPTEPEELPEEVVSFNVPAEMRGTFLVPGVDFLKTEDTSEATLTAEIDAAFAAAKSLTINAVVIDTAYEDSVIYQTRNAPELSSEFDLLGYIVGRAKDEGFYTYAIFDATPYSAKPAVTALSVGGGGVDKLAANLSEFAERYALDGVLVDGFQNSGAEGSYGDYLTLGGGMGFGNFMRQSPAAVVKTASAAIREAAPATQVGILADAVWENQSRHEAGSATEALFTSLSGGNADTKGFVEKGFVDFVAVKAYTTMESATEPFHEVARWWGEVARENDIPMYIVHAADKIGSGESGWGSQDQILKQVIEAAEISGVRGSIFNRLAPLASPATNIGTNLTKLYTEEAAPAEILTQLEMTKPAETTFTTSDPVVTFTGASDPGEPVTINDQVVDTDQTGYFTAQLPLKTGVNNFTIRHKDKQIDYAVTRELDVLEAAAPMQDVTVEGGMTVTITAIAYMDADVWATVGGETISMRVDEAAMEDEETRDGFFRTFVGEFTAPAATGETQSLGGITVHAQYDGEEDAIAGGGIYVNKKARLEDGVAVRVVAEQAITYPPNTSNNVPSASYYPLPQGAMDYAVGDEIAYSRDGETFRYFVLASGLRVESKDIAAITDDYPSNNVISGLSVDTDSRYTYVTLDTAQQVSYSVGYSSSAISFEFHNTASTPADMNLSKNPLFTHADWSGSTLTLSFLQQGSFMGYKGYYGNNGDLVLRFKNPPSSISAARIAIDPGHGGGDQGTSGFLADYPEKEINRRIAAYLAAELEARGAEVYLMDNSGIEGPERKRQAEAWDADLFVSVHSNSAPNTNATGTEVYYFHPFSYRLANAAAGYVSSGLDSNNRGAKQSYYHVSLSSQFPSVLVECGFLSNKGEYEKLVSKGYQQAIAVGIADALSATVKATYTGGGYSGNESTGSGSGAGSGTGSQGSDKRAIDVSITGTTIDVGESESLTLKFSPANASSAVTWKSSDSNIVTVRDGKVTGVKEGKATITATISNGVTDSCTVTVTKGGSSSGQGNGKRAIDVSVTGTTIDVGETESLKLTFSPEGASSAVTWKSSDTKVVTVKDGKVTGVKEGKATITATISNGVTDSCTVTVIKGSSGSSGSGGRSDAGARLSEVDRAFFEYDEIEMKPGKTERLEVLSEDYEVIRGRDFKWKSDDTTVATVDDFGYATAKTEGEAVITAEGGGYRLTISIYVIDGDVKVDAIYLSDYELDMDVGDERQLDVEFDPDYADPALVWESSDDVVVAVDRYGNIEALEEGEATIVCYLKNDEDIFAECEIVVRD